MSLSRLRSRISVLLVLPALVLGTVALAPNASAGGATPGFESSDFQNWNSSTNPLESITGNVGSEFTVSFPAQLNSVCGQGEAHALIPCFSTMTVESTSGSVSPSSGTIDISTVTTFTIRGSGTLWLRPTYGVACASGCEPLTIVVTGIGPNSLVSSTCREWQSNGLPSETVSGHIGDTFMVTFPSLVVAVGSMSVQTYACPNLYFSETGNVTSPNEGVITTPDPTLFTISGPGTITFTAYGDTSVLTPLELSITVTVIPGDGPPDVLQQVGAPRSGTCVDVADANLNWSGAPSGGWTMSWAQWVNNGSGGAVCTRSLYWLTSGRWGVRT